MATMNRIEIYHFRGTAAAVALPVAHGRDEKPGRFGGFMLQGKVALVTGLAGRNRLRDRQALARKGCAVMLNGFGDADWSPSACGLRALGVDADYHGADLSVPDADRRPGGDAERRFGKVDIAVNNAVTRTGRDRRAAGGASGTTRWRST